MIKLQCLCLLALLAVACAARGSRRPDAAVQHVAIFWLKDHGNAEQIARISRISKSFSSIPGVLNVFVGTSLPSDRPIVDDSYDVAVIITFADTRAYHDFVNHPRHSQAVKDVVDTVVGKMRVYNIFHHP